MSAETPARPHRVIRCLQPTSPQSTKVFVHGVPETSAIWSPLVTELSTRGITNIVLLSPPGFGSPSPAGWGSGHTFGF